jgi:flagellar biosynthesis/type III secretory pathway protein FliH
MSSELRTAFAFEQLPPPPPGSGAPRDVLSDAWAEAEQIREQARLAGEREGLAAGLEAARAEVEQQLQALGSALAGIESVRAELLSALEHDAVEMAFSLAERILAGTLSVEPERVIDVARNALRRLTDRHRMTLVVNPADLELVAGSVDMLRAELGGIEHCDVQADRRVARGGTIVRTEAGEIDATIEAGIDRAREVVAAALKKPGEAPRG